MLYPFAILPNVFQAKLHTKSPSARKDIKHILRGLCENGLLIDLHKGGWSRHVQEILADLPPELSAFKSDILSCFSRLKDRNRIVNTSPCPDGLPVDSQGWSFAALEEHERNRLYAIILTPFDIQQFGVPHPVFLELSAVTDSDLWLDRRRSMTIRMERSSYECALRGLLSYARTVDLIDPYFNCDELRFWDVVIMCARLLGLRRPSPGGRIRVHAGDRTDELPCDRIAGWRQRLLPLTCSYPSIRFEVCLWSHQHTSVHERIHDRFIITDQCGINVPSGLAIQSTSTVWGLLDEEDRIGELQKYRDTETFRLLDRTTVPN